MCYIFVHLYISFKAINKTDGSLKQDTNHEWSYFYWEWVASTHYCYRLDTIARQVFEYDIDDTYNLQAYVSHSFKIEHLFKIEWGVVFYFFRHWNDPIGDKGFQYMCVSVSYNIYIYIYIYIYI